MKKYHTTIIIDKKGYPAIVKIHPVNGYPEIFGVEIMGKKIDFGFQKDSEDAPLHIIGPTDKYPEMIDILQQLEGLYPFEPNVVK